MVIWVNYRICCDMSISVMVLLLWWRFSFSEGGSGLEVDGGWGGGFQFLILMQWSYDTVQEFDLVDGMTVWLLNQEKSI